MIAHVFIVFGALSVLAARRVLESLAKGGSPNDTRAFVFSTVAVQPGTFAEEVVVRVMYPLPSTLSEWSKPFALAKFTKTCEEELRLTGASELVVYCPHVYEVPANFFAFGSRWVIRRELLADGLANYVPRPVVPRTMRKGLGYFARTGLRILAAKVNGLSYRVLLEGDMTQYECIPWARTWTFRARGLITKRGEVCELPFLSEDARADAALGGVLFIDQELDEIADKALQLEMRETVASVLRQLGRPVVYKSHPRGMNRISTLTSVGVSALPAPERPAEFVALEGSFETVVGFYSSTLLLISEEGVETIAILPRNGAGGVLRRGFIVALKKTFRECGIRIIEAG